MPQPAPRKRGNRPAAALLAAADSAIQCCGVSKRSGIGRGPQLQAPCAAKVQERGVQRGTAPRSPPSHAPPISHFIVSPLIVEYRRLLPLSGAALGKEGGAAGGNRCTGRHRLFMFLRQPDAPADQGGACAVFCSCTASLLPHRPGDRQWVGAGDVFKCAAARRLGASSRRAARGAPRRHPRSAI